MNITKENPYYRVKVKERLKFVVKEFDGIDYHIISKHGLFLEALKHCKESQFFSIEYIDKNGLSSVIADYDCNGRAIENNCNLPVTKGHGKK